MLKKCTLLTPYSTEDNYPKRVHLPSSYQVQKPINLLTPNVNYGGRTAPLTSKVAFYIFIQQI